MVSVAFASDHAHAGILPPPRFFTWFGPSVVVSDLLHIGASLLFHSSCRMRLAFVAFSMTCCESFVPVLNLVLPKLTPLPRSFAQVDAAAFVTDLSAFKPFLPVKSFVRVSSVVLVPNHVHQNSPLVPRSFPHSDSVVLAIDHVHSSVSPLTRTFSRIRSVATVLDHVHPAAFLFLRSSAYFGFLTLVSDFLHAGLPLSSQQFGRSGAPSFAFGISSMNSLSSALNPTLSGAITAARFSA